MSWLVVDLISNPVRTSIHFHSDLDQATMFRFPWFVEWMVINHIYMENRINNQESDGKKTSITQEEIYRAIREAYDVADNKED